MKNKILLILFVVLFFFTTIYAQKEAICTYEGTNKSVAMCFSSDGKKFAMVSYKTIHVYETGSQKELQKLDIAEGIPKRISFADNDQRILMVVVDESSENSLKSLASMVAQGITGTSNAVAINGNTFAAAMSNMFVKKWDLTKNLIETNQIIPNSSNYLTVFTADGFSNLKSSFNPTSIVLSPDNKLIAIANLKTEIELIDTQTGIKIKSWFGHKGFVTALCFSADGKYLFSGSSDETIKIWDAQTGTCIHTLGNNCTINSLCFSPDGKRFASGDAKGIIRIWDFAKREPVLMWETQQKTVDALSFSADGSTLASHCETGQYQIWEMNEFSTTKKRIQVFVEQGINEWLKKGEFEKSTDYQARTNEKNRKEKISFLTKEIVATIKKEYLSRINWKELQIEGKYDADHESFLLKGSDSATYVINVSLNSAKDFKEKFANANVANADAVFDGNDFKLSYFEVSIPTISGLFIYDNTGKVGYTSNIEYTFDTPKIEIQKQEVKVNEPVEVDTNIPINADTNTNTFVLIIGNEDYKTYQSTLKSEANVAFAQNDAQIFRDYVLRTLGVPEKNVSIKINATLGQMKQAIARLAAIAEVNKSAKLIFYYSGHGLPDEQTHESYIIPVDISGSDIKQAINLNELYQQLTAPNCERVTVFLDACFSGGARNESLIALKGVKIKPKKDELKGNIVVFSSSTGEESSTVHSQKQHGLFTYFLLKKLQDSKGNLTYKDLSNYLVEKVSLESVLVNNKKQTPQINGSSTILNSWQDWKLK